MSDHELDLSTLPPRAQNLIKGGRAAQRHGHIDSARTLFEMALHELTVAQNRTAASLLRWIAWTHSQSGDSEAALDCLEVAEVLATEDGDDRALASTLNTRAGTLFNRGELDQAEALFTRVRSLASQMGDKKLQAMADQNLGSVSSIRGDLSVALGHFQSSLKTFESLELDEYVGPLLNNIGRLQIDLGRDEAAERSLLRARDLCEGRGDQHHHIVVEVNRARLLLRTGKPEAALKAGQAAKRLATHTGDERWKSEIQLVIGTAYARVSQPKIALRFLEGAADTARGRQDAKVLADALLEQATTLRDLGDNRETLIRLNEAHRIFHRLRARRALADVDERIWNLEAIYLDIVTRWGESLEANDAYTQGHCARVADIACMLAGASGLPEEEMNWFRMGALLHDVGKVTVPHQIINKPGPLEAREWALMSRHPVAGLDLLKDVDFPWDVRPMIRHHHERWDGTGYPDRIRGEDIPLVARILTVADVYDALTSDRSYRRGFDRDAALGIMESEAGRGLDPDLFPLFADKVVHRLPTLWTRKPSRTELAYAI